MSECECEKQEHIRSIDEMRVSHECETVILRALSGNVAECLAADTYYVLLFGPEFRDSRPPNADDHAAVGGYKRSVIGNKLVDSGFEVVTGEQIEAIRAASDEEDHILITATIAEQKVMAVAPAIIIILTGYGSCVEIGQIMNTRGAPSRTFVLHLAEHEDSYSADAARTVGRLQAEVQKCTAVEMLDCHGLASATHFAKEYIEVRKLENALPQRLTGGGI